MINLTEAFIIYYFGMLYIQIVELFLPFDISKILMVFLVSIIIINILKKKLKISLRTFIFELVCMAYLFIYYAYFQLNLINAVPLINFASVAVFIVNNIKYNQIKNWRVLENLALGYLFINLVLYLLKVNNTFQIDGGVRFKGALPHANMLALMLVSLFIVFFYCDGIKSVIIKFLGMLLLLVNGSRTYILCALAIVIINILFRKSIKNKLIFKIEVVGFSLVLLYLGLWNILMQSDVLYRFNYYLFSDNGRNILTQIMNSVSNNSSILDKIFGFEMGIKYLLLSPTYYSHGFGENSFLSVYMLSGYIGIIFLALFLIKYFRNSKLSLNPLPFIMVFAIVLISLYFQDTILSTQSSISIFGVLSIMNTYKEKL